MHKLTEGYGLIEAPVWDPARGLLFSDALFGGVFCIDAEGGVSSVFEHRRGIGGMALHTAGGLVVSGRNISFKPFDGGATLTLLDADEANGNVGYNDLTTDAEGRIYAGSLGASPVFEDGREPRAGSLYLIGLDGTGRIVAEDIELTNGLGLSPDGKCLYHSDSRRAAVFRYRVGDDGSLGRKEPFVVTPGVSPDGLAVSEDGAVWVALAGGGGVGVYEPTGKQRDFLAIPQPTCTSLCFGGTDRKDLYVVSGSLDPEGERVGAVYRTRTAVAGLPVAAARTTIG